MSRMFESLTNLAVGYSACTTKAKIIPKEIYIMFNFKIINQNQLEVILPPCKFKLLNYKVEDDIINLIVKPKILSDYESLNILKNM